MFRAPLPLVLALLLWPASGPLRAQELDLAARSRRGKELMAAGRYGEARAMLADAFLALERYAEADYEAFRKAAQEQAQAAAAVASITPP